MEKTKKVHKLLIATMFIAIAGVFIAMGIIAIQNHSMKFNINFDISPSLYCKINASVGDESSYATIFCNKQDEEQVGQGWKANGNILSYSSSTDTTIYFQVWNYSTEEMMITSQDSVFLVSAENTEAVSFSLSISTGSSVDLKIIRSMCSVTYNANGGIFANGTTTIQSVRYNTTYSMPVTNPTHSDNEVNFLGWATSKTAYFADWSDTATAQTCVGDATWYAVWYRANTMLPGVEFNKIIKQINKTEAVTFYASDESIRFITFDTWSDTYASQVGTWDTGIPVSSDASIKAFAIDADQDEKAKKETIYVLLNSSDSENTTLYAPINSLKMFYKFMRLTSINFNNFNTSKVTDMSGMFYDCEDLSALDVSNFDTSNVTDMSEMFSDIKFLTTLDVRNFDTSNVTDMSYMFAGSHMALDGTDRLESINLRRLDTSNVTNMSYMFYNCRGLTTLDVSGFDTSKVTDMSYMFAGCVTLTTLNVSNFDTSNVTNMSYMFSGMLLEMDLIQINLGVFNTSSVTDMSNMFSNCIGLTELDVSSFDTSNVTDMSYMFEDCSGLTELDVSNFDTSTVTDMSYMFRNCSGLTELDVSSFDTSKVTTMSYMFDDCRSLTTLDVSRFDTSKATTMSYMFCNCSGLTELDVSNFYTSKVTGMSYMFSGCSGLTELDVSNFDTSNVRNMGHMFDNCSGLTELDVSSFDTSKVEYMSNMFYRCSNLTSLDLSSFDTSKVTTMSSMFKDCSGLTRIFVGDNWSTESVKESSEMFGNCTSLVGGSGTVYNDSYIDKAYAKVDGGTSSPGYLTYKAPSA